MVKKNSPFKMKLDAGFLALLFVAIGLPVTYFAATSKIGNLTNQQQNASYRPTIAPSKIPTSPPHRPTIAPNCRSYGGVCTSSTVCRGNSGRSHGRLNCSSSTICCSF